jgi:hypothetical protein
MKRSTNPSTNPNDVNIVIPAGASVVTLGSIPATNNGGHVNITFAGGGESLILTGQNSHVEPTGDAHHHDTQH